MEMFKPFRRFPNDPNLYYSNLKKTGNRLWQVDVIANDKFSANHFRKIIGSRIPNFGIGRILLENNTSYTADEFMSMRLGLIPIISKINIQESLDGLDLDTIENNDNFGCFELNVECPKDAKRPMVIMSGDLVQESYPSDFEVLNKNIIITKLMPGQAINLSAVIQIGSGSFNTFNQNCRDHAKWNPVNNCIFVESSKDEVSSPDRMNMRSFEVGRNSKQKTYRIEMELVGTLDPQTILDMAMKLYGCD